MNDKTASRVCPNFLVCHGQGNSNPNSQGLRHYVVDHCPSNQSNLKTQSNSKIVFSIIFS